MGFLDNLVGPDFARGYVKANQARNEEQLSLKHERYRSMAEMYGHLAQNAADPELAKEFTNRSFQFASGNPLDGKSDKTLSKMESPSDIFDSYHKRKSVEPSPMGNAAPQDEYDISNFIGQKPTHFDPTGMKVNPEFERYQREQSTIEPQITQMRMKQKISQHLMDQFSKEGIDPESPEAEIRNNVALRAAGINEATPTFQPYPTTLLGEDGQRHPVLLQHGLRSGKFYMSTPEGRSVQVHPDLPTPQIKIGPDGNVYPVYAGSAMGAPIGNVGVQSGTQTLTHIDPLTNESTSKKIKTFSGGGPSTSQTPLVNEGLNLGVNGTVSQVPTAVGGRVPYLPAKPSTVTPVAKVNGVASQNSAPIAPPRIVNGPIDWESMVTQAPSTEDKALADYVVHPETWKPDAKGVLLTAWRPLWAKYGLPPNGPAPIDPRTQGQRDATVSGIQSLNHIRNILGETNGAVVGVVAGRWIKAMNELGSAQGMGAVTNDKLNIKIGKYSGKFGTERFSPDLGSWEAPNTAKLYQVASNTPGVNPQQAEYIAQRASDLITSMRVFNIQELRSLSGASQGISRIFAMLEPAMANPKMDMPIIEGHLKSLGYNFMNNLREVEQRRWGPNIPYIREKDDLAALHFYPKQELQINNVMSKTGMSRADAVFEAWRRGLLKDKQE